MKGLCCEWLGKRDEKILHDLVVLARSSLAIGMIGKRGKQWEDMWIVERERDGSQRRLIYWAGKDADGWSQWVMSDEKNLLEKTFDGIGCCCRRCSTEVGCAYLMIFKDVDKDISWSSKKIIQSKILGELINVPDQSRVLNDRPSVDVDESVAKESNESTKKRNS